MIFRKLFVRALVVGVLLLAGASAMAAAPAWMPNFPMRIGAAGAMGMWMPLPGATEYKVYRQLGGGEWVEIYKGPMLNFQDPAAPGDQDVSYKVVAVIGGADSDPSAVVTLKGEKPIEPPANFSNRLVPEEKSLQLRWDRVPGASFYNLYRGATPDAMTLITSSQETKSTDSAIEDKTTYYYAVSSVSATSQESKRSEPLKVDVVFPVVKVVKKFDPVRREMTLFAKSTGEDFAAFNTPSDVQIFGERVYVADASGIQVLDLDGVFIQRLEVVEEKIRNKEWSRPASLTIDPSGKSIWMNVSGSSKLAQISLDGTALLSEIVIPARPGNPLKPEPSRIKFNKDGTLWLINGTYSDLLVLPEPVQPKDESGLRRIGYSRGLERESLPDELRFVGLVEGLFLEEGLYCGIENANAQFVCIDPKVENVTSPDGVVYTPASAIKRTFGSAGGSLGEFNALTDVRKYDDKTVICLDPLAKTVKRFDVTTGDYLESFVDDPEGKKLNLVAPGSISRVAWSGAKNRLYVLSGFESTLFIYDVK